MRTPYDHFNIEAMGRKLRLNNLWLKPIEFDGFKKLDWLNIIFWFNPFEFPGVRKLAGLNIVKVGCRCWRRGRRAAMGESLVDLGERSGGLTNISRAQIAAEGGIL